MSKFEDKILQILKENKIALQREKTFNDLKSGLYRYDFYCPNINGYQVIIECNGRQHYEQTKYFQKTRKDFLTQQEHDRRKISYAISHNIRIYCIPFWEEDNIHTLSDLLNIDFLAKNKWHNDDAWREYNKNL